MPTSLVEQLNLASMRTIRTKWLDVNPFAQEMYTILRSLVGEETTQTEVSPTEDGENPFVLPPISIPGFPTFDLTFPEIPIIPITHGDLSVTQPPGIIIPPTGQPPPLDPGEELPPDEEVPPGEETPGSIPGEAPGNDVPVVPRTTSTIQRFVVRSAVPGRIVSGENSDYTVTLFPNGFFHHEGYDLGAAPFLTVLASTLEQRDSQLEEGQWVTVFRFSGWEVTERTGPKGVARTAKVIWVEHWFSDSTGTGGGSVIGIVGSKIEGGEGDDAGRMYSVTIYPNGLHNESAGEVEVRQGQIDIAEILPEGTYVMVSQLGGRWYCQSPVFL